MFSSVQLRNAGYTIKSLVENDNLPKLKLFMQRLIDTKVFGTNEYLIPLYYAAFFGRFKILMWLMKKSKCGADMEIRFTSNNKSVLCNFTGHPIDMDMETFLYQRQVDPYDIIYFQQRSPLLSIAAAGTSNAHVAIVEHLLKQNANPNHMDCNNWPPINYILEKGGFMKLDCLLEYKADPNYCSSRGFTPLMLATRPGLSDSMDCLLRYQANVNLKDEGGRTSFFWASTHGNYNAMRKLLDHQFNSGIWIRDRHMFKHFDDWNPFHNRCVVLAYCWSLKLSNPLNYISLLPLELFHMLLMILWGEQRATTWIK